MKTRLLFVLTTLALLSVAAACAPTAPPPRESVEVEQQRNSTESAADEARRSAMRFGYSIEVWNLLERIKRTNDPAHIQWIYFVSPFTGKVIFQATALGKVTSTTKRLEPAESYLPSGTDCPGNSLSDYCALNQWVVFERVNPDGAYGTSTSGIVWFDTAGLMYEAKVEGVFILMLERPYVFPDDTINLTVDIRLQTDQIDEERYAVAVRVQEYIQTHPEWRPGDEIPIDVLTGSSEEK